jgi:hypothetical protein
MYGKIWPLVTDGPVSEFKKWQCKFKTLKQIADALRSLYRRYQKPLKENLKISTCNDDVTKRVILTPDVNSVISDGAPDTRHSRKP